MVSFIFLTDEFDRFALSSRGRDASGAREAAILNCLTIFRTNLVLANYHSSDALNARQGEWDVRRDSLTRHLLDHPE
jgi:hypothetical protein